ncbi:hypothetical protein [Jatrophihabitans sp.]|uniref:hypothetical protein n=1 Tax=Jatrophihabitans sp. TaxID=1932789 RepID=UPI002C58FCF2|nr:hypothetical protein [Jatrophihabitans sp.]
MTAAGLLVDAVLHLQLAANYQLAAPGGIGQGNLFRIEAVLAVLAALLLVLRHGNRTAYAMALLMAGGGLTALLVYRYYQLPAFGPFPAMYEPVWFFKKSLAAIAEAVATAAALAGYLQAGQSISVSAANH